VGRADQSQGWPQRGQSQGTLKVPRLLCTAIGGVAVAVGLVLFEQAARAFLDEYLQHILVLMGINMLLASSLNLINGQTGQFSIGHAGFMAVGAYISGGLAVHHRQAWFGEQVANAPVFFALLVAGGCGAAVCGLLVGLPTLRLRGDYLAIATLGFGEIVRIVLLNLRVVGGARGLTDIPRCTTLLATWAVLALSIWFLRNLTGSRFGRAFRAIREDEVAAEALGINTTKYKVFAFAVGAFFAGIAGGLFAHDHTVLAPGAFGFMRSVEIILMCVLGGNGSTSGALLGAAILTGLPEALRGVQTWFGIEADLRMVVYSALLIMLMLLRPSGIMGYQELSWAALRSLGRKVVRLGTSRA